MPFFGGLVDAQNGGGVTISGRSAMCLARSSHDGEATAILANVHLKLRPTAD